MSNYICTEVKFDIHQGLYNGSLFDMRTQATKTEQNKQYFLKKSVNDGITW